MVLLPVVRCIVVLTVFCEAHTAERLSTGLICFVTGSAVTSSVTASVAPELEAAAVPVSFAAEKGWEAVREELLLLLLLHP